MITKIDEGIYRGPQPKTEEDWQALQKLGIKYLLDLETGASLLSDGDPLNETLKAEKYGMKSYSHPLGEILPPTYSELKSACDFIETHKPIYIHCKAGVDRTGMVCATYRVRIFAWSKEDAIKEMFAMGMHIWYYWWSLFL